jgi:hypothetical protein
MSMPMTQKEVLQGEIIRPPGPRKLYLIPGKTMGMHIPQTLVALDENELEEHKRFYSLIIEIGDAHPDLAHGIEWEVYGIRGIDIWDLPGNPPRKKKGEHEVDS